MIMSFCHDGYFLEIILQIIKCVLFRIVTFFHVSKVILLAYLKAETVCKLSNGTLLTVWIHMRVEIFQCKPISK